MSVEKEIKSNEPLIIFMQPYGQNYNLTDTQMMLNEINQRLKSHKTQLRRIMRPLYGMKLVGFVDENILKMAQIYPTDVYAEYWYADLKNGGRLYVEEGKTKVFLSIITNGDGEGYSDFNNFV